MNISQNGINKIKEWEGFKNKVYLDSAGLPTIGVGHLLTKDELRSGKINFPSGPVKFNEGLSDFNIETLLKRDLFQAEQSIRNFINVELNQNQYDTLVSFCFNVGSTAFMNSTLRRKLNDGAYQEIPAQLRRWKYSGGKVVQGLINRRKKEIELWNSGSKT